MARWLLLAALVAALVGVVRDQSETDPASQHEHPTGAPPAAVGMRDGVLTDGVTVFDSQYPGIAKLDGVLIRALRAAAADAAGDGVRFYVESGWRSRSYQEQLLRQAIAKYGSPETAARWVASPQTSAHVSGAAVDVGPAKAAKWLSRYGARYGLCQIYRNEPWHFELRPDAVADRCPGMYADAAARRR